MYMLQINFLQTKFKYHLISNSIASENDLKFILELWKHLIKLAGVQQKMPMSCHLQAAGASKIIDRTIENHKSCYYSYHQND